jgi:hypothetical protein
MGKGCGPLESNGMSPDRHESIAQSRPRWAFEPLEIVGPLRFGMTVDEAAEALPEAYEIRRFQAEPYFPDVVGIEVGFRPAAPAIEEYFNSAGQLFCIAIDAVRGPRITLSGAELTGAVPAALEPWLFDLSDAMGGTLRYGPRGNPGINELGMVLRVQDTSDDLLVRPVLVGREWADDCVDDWEGVIPECEWIGHLWPDARFTDRESVWPRIENPPAWKGRWHPPF